MPRPDPHALVHKLAMAARADPRKATVLAVLSLVMGLAWTRLLSNQGPTRASAMVAPSKARQTPDNTFVSATTRPGTANLLREWTKSPIGALSRNLFYINPSVFPSDGSKPSAVVVEHGFWDDLAKSVALRSEEDGKRQQRVDALKWQAAQLHLQSILLDAQPKALVDGQLLKVGDIVANFRVVKIHARGIVLEREGIKLEVQFK